MLFLCIDFAIESAGRFFSMASFFKKDYLVLIQDYLYIINYRIMSNKYFFRGKISEEKLRK
jgi:hypothetical protein